MKLPLTFCVLSLAACGGMKSVPIEALAEVSTASVVQLANLELEVTESKQALAHVSSRHDEIARNVRSTNSALNSANADLDSSKQNRGTAVYEGDVTTAKALATDVDAAESTVERRSDRADEQTTLLTLLTQGVDVRAGELDASLARLEMARAEAAIAGGAVLKVQKFERQRDRYDKGVDCETAELHELETDLGRTLQSFDSPTPNVPRSAEVGSPG